MLEVYYIRYTPNDGFISIHDGKPVITTLLAEATQFHTPMECLLIRQKFNLTPITKTVILKDPQFVIVEGE